MSDYSNERKPVSHLHYFTSCSCVTESGRKVAYICMLSLHYFYLHKHGKGKEFIEEEMLITGAYYPTETTNITLTDINIQ